MSLIKTLWGLRYLLFMPSLTTTTDRNAYHFTTLSPSLEKTLPPPPVTSITNYGSSPWTRLSETPEAGSSCVSGEQIRGRSLQSICVLITGKPLTRSAFIPSTVTLHQLAHFQLLRELKNAHEHYLLFSFKKKPIKNTQTKMSIFLPNLLSISL